MEEGADWDYVPIGNGFGDRVPVVITRGNPHLVEQPREIQDIEAVPTDADVEAWDNMFDTEDVEPQRPPDYRQTDLNNFFRRPNQNQENALVPQEETRLVTTPQYEDTALIQPDIVENEIQLDPRESARFFQQSVLLATVMTPIVGVKNMQAGLLGWALNSAYGMINFREAAIEEAIDHWSSSQEEAWKKYFDEFGISPASAFKAIIMAKYGTSANPNIPKPPDYIHPELLHKAKMSSRMKRWGSLGLFFLFLFFMGRKRKKE